MTQAQKEPVLYKARLAAMLVLAITLLSSASGLQAQILVVPANMPTVYREVPEYVIIKSKARHKVTLSQCAMEFRGDGYYLTSGNKDFVILNQNPACLKRFVGKRVAVQGRTTESLVPWHKTYFVVIDKINGMQYDGKVTPWMIRQPTDEEISYWNCHKQLPPATQKFLDYLALPKSLTDICFTEDESSSDTMTFCAVTSENDRSTPSVNRQLEAIQRHLTVIEQKVSKPRYRGIYSVPQENWEATDWSLYMDLQGGG